MRVIGKTKYGNKSLREHYERSLEVNTRSGQADLRVKALDNGPTGRLFAGLEKSHGGRRQ